MRLTEQDFLVPGEPPAPSVVREWAAERANQLIERWLEDAPRVVGVPSPSGLSWAQKCSCFREATHEARVVSISKIKEMD